MTYILRCIHTLFSHNVVSQDISKNFLWLKPACELSPHKAGARFQCAHAQEFAGALGILPGRRFYLLGPSL